MIIRDATDADLPGILAIYNEVIVNCWLDLVFVQRLLKS